VEKAIEDWKQEAQKSPTEQYYILAHGHSLRTPDRLQSVVPPLGVPPSDEHGMVPGLPGNPGFGFGFGFGFGRGSDDRRDDRR